MVVRPRIYRIIKEAAEPGAILFRIGDQWAVVWKDRSAERAHRWAGRLVSQVDERNAVWWTCHTTGRQKQEVVASLTEQARA